MVCTIYYLVFLNKLTMKIMFSELNLSVAGIYLGAIAYGFTFISSQHYIYLRSNPSDRSFSLSLCHFWYLLGIAISATIIFPLQKSDNFDKEIVKYIGVSVTITSLVCGILLGVNEYFHKTKKYNYKESLDIDVNRESDSNEIFELKYFEIRNPEATVLLENRIVSQKFSPKKRGYISLIVLILKLRNAILFYYPFIVFFFESTKQSGKVDSIVLWIWLPVIGVTLSTILLRIVDAKRIFEASNIFLFFSLIYLSTALWTNTEYLDNRFPLFLVFLALGFGYSIPDNIVLDTAFFLHTEMFLSLGFSIEMVPIGIIQYYCFTNGIVLDISIVIPVIVFIVLLFFYDWIYLIKTFKQTILQINNVLNGFDYDQNWPLERDSTSVNHENIININNNKYL